MQGESRRQRRLARQAHRMPFRLPRVPRSLARIPGSLVIGAAFLFVLHLIATVAHPAASASVSDASPQRHATAAVAAHLPADAATPAATPSAEDAPTVGPGSDAAAHGVAPGAEAARRDVAPVNVVGFGDSVSTSNACDCLPYLNAVARSVAAATQRRVGAVTNWGSDGIGVNGVAEQLTQQAVRASLAPATVVTIAVGANDMPPAAPANDACRADSACFRGAVTNARTPLTRVIAQLKQLAPQATVVVLGYWNVYLDGAVGAAQGAEYPTQSAAMTRVFNQMAEAASKAAGAQFVDLSQAFARAAPQGVTALLTDDGDHPNARGHGVVAQAVVARLLAGR